MRSLKIYFCLFIAFLISAQIGYSQCAKWKKHHNYWEVKAGFGLIPTFAKSHAQSELPPMSLEVSYRPNKKFSIGVLAGRSISTVSQSHFTGVKQNFRHDFQMLALRAGVNTQRWEKWQAYGGILLAFQHSKIESNTNGTPPGEETLIYYSPKSNKFFYSGFVGTAYFPTPQLKIFGELSYGLSIATMGIGYNF